MRTSKYSLDLPTGLINWTLQEQFQGRWQQIEKFGSVEEVKVWTTVLTI